MFVPAYFILMVFLFWGMIIDYPLYSFEFVNLELNYIELPPKFNKYYNINSSYII